LIGFSAALSGSVLGLELFTTRLVDKQMLKYWKIHEDISTYGNLFGVLFTN